MSILDVARNYTNNFKQKAMSLPDPKSFVQALANKDLSSRPGIQSINSTYQGITNRDLSSRPGTQSLRTTGQAIANTFSPQNLQTYKKNVINTPLPAIKLPMIQQQMPQIPQLPKLPIPSVVYPMAKADIWATNKLINQGKSSYNNLATNFNQGYQQRRQDMINAPTAVDKFNTGLSQASGLPQEFWAAKKNKMDHVTNEQMTNFVLNYGGLVNPLTATKANKIDDLVELSINKSKNQEQAIKRLNYLTDEIVSKGSKLQDYTQRLETLKNSFTNKLADVKPELVNTIETQITKIDDAIKNAPTQDLRLDRTKLPQNWLSKTNEQIVSLLGGRTSKQIARETPSKYATISPNEYLITTANQKKVNALDYLRTPDRVMKKIGLGKEAKELRTAWGSYEKQLPQEIDKVSEWYSRVGQSKESSKNIFLWLDGNKKINLSPVEQEVANEIKDYYAQWAKRLRLPEDKQISDYVTHIFAKDIIEKDFNEDLAKIIDQKVAKSVYDPFLQARLGVPEYKQDVFAALDAYVKRASRKENLDPVLTTIGNKAESLDLSSWKYVKSYIDRVNMRPTDIDNLMDNLIKQTPVGYKFGSRPTTVITRKVRQWIYRGTLGLNAKSAFKNLMQGANTYAELGEKYTGIGYIKAVKNMAMKSDELEKVGVLSDTLIQDRQLSVKKKTIETIDKGLFYLFDKAEQINRGSAYFGAKQRALDAGQTMDEAIDAGIEMARKTQFTFGSIDTPPVLSSDIAKTLAQFSSYGVKQGEFIAEKIQKKEVAKIVRWLGANAVILYGVGDLMGMDWKDLIPSVRIGGSPAFTLAKDIGETALNSPDQYGNQPDTGDRISTLSNDLVPLIPGGVAIKRAVQGGQAWNQGYSTNRSGNVQYPIEKTPGNLIKSTLLGKYSTPEANQYYDSNARPLSEKQSEVFKQSMDRNFQYQQIMNERQDNALVDQAKEIVRQTGQETEVAGKVLYWDQDSGEVKTVMLNRDVEYPTLTGNEILDEKMVSRFKSAITSKTNDIVTLFELGRITQDEAEKQLQALEDLKDDFNKAKKGKKPAKVALKKAKTSKVKAPSTPEVSTAKSKAPPKTKEPRTKSLANMSTTVMGSGFKPSKPVIRWTSTGGRKATLKAKR